MNQPIPMMPQGPAQDGRNKTKILITVCVIVALHVVPISGLLLVQGCSRSEVQTAADGTMPETAGTRSGSDGSGSETILPPPGEGEPAGEVPEVSLAAANEGESGSPPAVPDQRVQETSEPPIDVVQGDMEVPAEEFIRQESTFTIPHVIVKGDRLYDLARKYGVTSEDIKKANPDVNPRRLQLGQQILIPKINYHATGDGEGAVEKKVAMKTGTPPRGNHYVIQRGDTLSGIAHRNGITLRMLREANGLRSDGIRAGDKLWIPQPVTEIASASND